VKLCGKLKGEDLAALEQRKRRTSRRGVPVAGSMVEDASPDYILLSAKMAQIEMSPAQGFNETGSS